jgi:CheY-like chemotaxis protein
MNADRQPANEPAPPPSGEGRPHRVLFVDDEPLIARLGEQFLRKLGYDTVVQTDPMKALDIFLNSQFDLVITDLSMPLLSGLELGKRLREKCPEQRIILTTAYHSMLEGKDVRELGFCDFLPKPYNLLTLQDSIRRALEPEPVVT